MAWVKKEVSDVASYGLIAIKPFGHAKDTS